MEKSKFVRVVGALLMILAMVLPAAPAAASTGSDGDVHAANIQGPIINPPYPAVLPAPSIDVADCTGSPNPSNDGQSRYFITVRSTSGLDVTNAVGRLIGPALPGQTPPVVTMSNGDFESQANDGNQPACVPAVNDGHANDLASPPTSALAGAWSIVVTAGGFQPAEFPLPADDSTGPCSLIDQRVCLISLGTLNLQPLSAPAGRGTISGSIFGPNGLPLNGAVVTLTDASGLVHTRISGTNCDGAATGAPGLPATGFYCFADSKGDNPGLPIGVANGSAFGFTNDGLGLPVGPASLTVVANGTNCVTGAPGTICGVLPATVTVNVAAGTVIGQDVTLQNKFAPAAAIALGANAGAFGYVVNGLGQGVGGVTVTATTPGGASFTAVCPSPPTGLNVTTPAPGTCTQTGLWIITGLPPATAGVTFTISGPNITDANVRPSVPAAANGSLPPPTIVAATTGPGTWIDPNWIIVQAGPPTGTIPLPVAGSAIIRGTVTDSQGQPFTGPGAFVVLYRDSSRSWAASTEFTPGVPAVVPAVTATGNRIAQTRPGTFGFFPLGAQIVPIVAAAALDAGGNYCFGSGGNLLANGNPVGCPTAAVGVAGSPVAQPPLLPDSYLVTVIDDRPTPACVAGFQPPAGGIGPAPCGNLPWTSQPVIAQQDRVTTVNVQLQAKFSPGAPPPGAGGIFGFLWDASVPGGRPLQGGTVYAVPVAGPGAVAAAGPLGALIPAGGITGPALLAGGRNLFDALAAFVGTVPLTGVGVLQGGVLTSTPPPSFPSQFVNPTFPGSDELGLYQIFGTIPGTTYAVIVETPGGYNDCAPNDFQVVTPALGYPGTGIPGDIVRCAVLVTAPAAGFWAAGADFAFAGQQLRPLEPGETDRQLESIIPFVGNAAPTAALGGWDIQTNEIRVVNGGPQRTIAEVRFYASDGLGGAGVLAGTQTADLVPGGARTFRAPDMPGGFLGWVGVWSFDADGPGQVYGQGALIVNSMNVIRNAGNASDSVQGVPRAEVMSPGSDSELPLAYKNWGGTANKWSTLLVADNLGDSAPVTFEFRSQDTTRSDARSCRNACVITRYANRGGMVTLNLGDETDPDIALLADGTYTVDVTAGGPLLPSGNSGILPGSVQIAMPGGYILQAINVSVTGKMATAGRSQQRLSATNTLQGPGDTENAGQIYLPLVFNNSNGWNSGIAVATSQTSGGTSAAVDVTFYNEDGGFVGDITNRLSSSGPLWIIYLPSVQFLPDKFRGTAVIHAQAAAGGAPGLYPGSSMTAAVYHVNYDRNAAISYDGIGSEAVAYRTEQRGSLPCISIGFQDCAWAAELYKTGTASAQTQQVGVETGIRLMNADPLLTGAPAQVTVLYIDDTGVIWNDAAENFVIPPLGVHTLFPLYNGRLPDVFRGSVRIMSAGNYVVGVANTVDYTVTDHDASGAYDLQYHTGHTR